MTLHVNIGRVVVEGAAFGAPEAARLQQALVAELGRLLAGTPPAPGPAPAGVPESAGRQVAQVVHANLPGPR